MQGYCLCYLFLECACLCLVCMYVRLFVCMCALVCVCTCLRPSIHSYICMRLHFRIFVCISAYDLIRVSECVCTCVCANLYSCKRALKLINSTCANAHIHLFCICYYRERILLTIEH